MKKHLKIVEGGIDTKPAVYVFRTEGKELVCQSTIFRDNQEMRLTQSQAKRLAKFVNEIFK